MLLTEHLFPVLACIMLCMAKPLPPDNPSLDQDSDLPNDFVFLLLAFLVVTLVAVAVAATSATCSLSDSEFEDITLSAEEVASGPSNGKRGGDASWVVTAEFENAQDFFASDLSKKLKKEFTAARKRQFEYAEVHEYRCKYSRKKGYLSCQWKMRVLFLSHCQAVRVESTESFQTHVHELDSVNINAACTYRWTPMMNEFVEQCVQNHGKPKVALR